jgi:DHA2 family multidrug resistance protein
MSVHAANAPTNKWLVTISITFGTLMGTIDASIVNVAINHIRGEVGATIEEITWITTGFVVASVLVMPLTAFFGRQFGQKRVYMACLALFIVGSFLCGIARGLTELIVFRAVQGFGAGALQPTEQAILRQTFPPDEQGTAMALFGMAIMIGPAVGPTLGGYIVDNYSWPWIFFINLPVGALGLFMVQRFVKEPEDIRRANAEAAARERNNVDWLGIGSLCVGISLLQYVLEEGNAKDWFDSGVIRTAAIVALVSLVAFVWRELTYAHPVVDLRLFKDRVFLAGSLIGALMFCMLMASMFLLPLFMQSLLGFTAMQSGLALLPRVLLMMVLTPVAGRLYGKVLSARVMVAFGALCFSAGSLLLSRLTLQSGARDLIIANLVQGLGFSFLFVPLTTVALSGISRHQLTNATGLSTLLRQIGGSIGLAAFATLLTRHAVHARAALVGHLGATDPEAVARLSAMRAALTGSGMDPISAQDAALRALDGVVTRQALMLSFDYLFLLGGLLFLGVLPLLVWLKQPANAPATHAAMEM